MVRTTNRVIKHDKRPIKHQIIFKKYGKNHKKKNRKQLAINPCPSQNGKGCLITKNQLPPKRPTSVVKKEIEDTGKQLKLTDLRNVFKWKFGENAKYMEYIH